MKTFREKIIDVLDIGDRHSDAQIINKIKRLIESNNSKACNELMMLTIREQYKTPEVCKDCAKFLRGDSCNPSFGTTCATKEDIK